MKKVLIPLFLCIVMHSRAATTVDSFNVSIARALEQLYRIAKIDEGCYYNAARWQENGKAQTQAFKDLATLLTTTPQDVVEKYKLQELGIQALAIQLGKRLHPTIEHLQSAHTDTMASNLSEGQRKCVYDHVEISASKNPSHPYHVINLEPEKHYRAESEDLVTIISFIRDHLPIADRKNVAGWIRHGVRSFDLYGWKKTEEVLLRMESDHERRPVTLPTPKSIGIAASAIGITAVAVWLLLKNRSTTEQ